MFHLQNPVVLWDRQIEATEKEIKYMANLHNKWTLTPEKTRKMRRAYTDTGVCAVMEAGIKLCCATCLNFQCNLGYTALHVLAATPDKWANIPLALAKGADVNVLTAHGLSAIEILTLFRAHDEDLALKYICMLMKTRKIIDSDRHLSALASCMPETGFADRIWEYLYIHNAPTPDHHPAFRIGAMLSYKRIVEYVDKMSRVATVRQISLVNTNIVNGALAHGSPYRTFFALALCGAQWLDARELVEMTQAGRIGLAPTRVFLMFATSNNLSQKPPERVLMEAYRVWVPDDSNTSPCEALVYFREKVAEIMKFYRTIVAALPPYRPMLMPPPPPPPIVECKRLITGYCPHCVFNNLGDQRSALNLVPPKPMLFYPSSMDEQD